MKAHKILLFMALAIALLAGVCVLFPAKGVRIADQNLRFPTLTKILNPQRELDIAAYLARQDSLNAVLDTLQDSMDFFRQQLDSSDTRFWFPNDDDTFFDTLFAQMEKTRSSGRTLRIVHYGDSQIEMDRMSDRLRIYMQDHFGGGGPGMVPFATLIPSYSVSTYGSGNLVRQSPFGDSIVVRANGNYGPMVQDFRVEGAAYSSITATTHRNRRPGPLKAVFSDRGSHSSDTLRCEETGVHAFSWQVDTAVTSLRISVSGAADLYGILVDNGPGVAVDNIPMRGCSGHQFSQINRDQLAEAYRLMDVGLIVLQFGGNSVPYLNNQKSIDAYCKNMGIQIDRLHQCCPHALILFIGPSDMSKRIRGEVQTYPIIPELIDSLAATATANGAAYWSIYHAMGGLNTMPQWTRQGLAGNDYIHFSQKGADKMGDLLAEAFDNSHSLYILEQRWAQLQPKAEKKAIQKSKAQTNRKARNSRRKRGGGR